MYQKLRPDKLIEARRTWLEKSLGADGKQLVEYDPDNPMPEGSARAFSWGAGFNMSRVKKAGHGADVEYVDYDIVFERDKGICYLCGKEVDTFNWHLDHIIPISRGGGHTYQNVGITHKSCNLKKSNMTADEYWDSTLYLSE